MKEYRSKIYAITGITIALLLGLLYQQVGLTSHEKDVKACILKFAKIKAETANIETVLLYPFVQGYQQLGYRNQKGKVIIPSRFTEARGFSQGRAVVSDRNWFKGFINPAGEVVIPHQFIWVSDFFDGIAVFSGTKRDREQQGFVDRDGKVLLQFRGAIPFEEFAGFRNGRAKVYVHPNDVPWQWITSPGNPVRKATGYVDCTVRITIEDWN